MLNCCFLQKMHAMFCMIFLSIMNGQPVSRGIDQKRTQNTCYEKDDCRDESGYFILFYYLSAFHRVIFARNLPALVFTPDTRY